MTRDPLWAETNALHQLQCADAASLTALAKMRYAMPSPSGTCPGGTYYAHKCTCDRSGTTNTCWAFCTVHSLPFLFALLTRFSYMICQQLL